MVNNCSFYRERIPECFSNYFYRSHFTHHWNGASAGVKHGNHSVVTGACSASEKLGPFCKMSIFLMTLVTGGQVLSMNKLMFWLCRVAVISTHGKTGSVWVLFARWSLDDAKATLSDFPLGKSWSSCQGKHQTLSGGDISVVRRGHQCCCFPVLGPAAPWPPQAFPSTMSPSRCRHCTLLTSGWPALLASACPYSHHQVAVTTQVAPGRWSADGLGSSTSCLLGPGHGMSSPSASASCCVVWRQHLASIKRDSSIFPFHAYVKGVN